VAVHMNSPKCTISTQNILLDEFFLSLLTTDPSHWGSPFPALAVLTHADAPPMFPHFKMHGYVNLMCQKAHTG